MPSTDTNATAIIQFAVGPLKITNVLVVGHIDCAGVRVALGVARDGNELPPPPLGDWIAPLVKLAQSVPLPPNDDEARIELAKANVLQQVGSSF